MGGRTPAAGGGSPGRGKRRRGCDGGRTQSRSPCRPRSRPCAWMPPPVPDDTSTHTQQTQVSGLQCTIRTAVPLSEHSVSKVTMASYTSAIPQCHRTRQQCHNVSVHIRQHCHNVSESRSQIPSVSCDGIGGFKAIELQQPSARLRLPSVVHHGVRCGAHMHYVLVVLPCESPGHCCGVSARHLFASVYACVSLLLR